MLLCLVKCSCETHRFEDISGVINLLGMRYRNLVLRHVYVHGAYT